MCNFVVGRACVLCHGQPVGEDAEESLVGKGGGGSRRKRNEVEEGGERERKNWTRGISLARYTVATVSFCRVICSWRGRRRRRRVTVENRDEGKCVSRESESGGRARVELELMIHTDGTSFKIVPTLVRCSRSGFPCYGENCSSFWKWKTLKICVVKWNYYSTLKFQVFQIDRTFFSFYRNRRSVVSTDTILFYFRCFVYCKNQWKWSEKNIFVDIFVR